MQAVREMTLNAEVMFSQATDVWSTPQWLFDALDKEFGFSLDPCSDGSNQKCTNHYTTQENGLLQEWGTETVFMNPPYSECAAWMRKAYGSAQGGGNRSLSGSVPYRYRLVASLCHEGRGALAARSVAFRRCKSKRTIPECGDCFQAARIQADRI